MARKISDPKCNHKRTGIVTSHPGVMPASNESHAATNCCDRPACIADAIEWASMVSGRTARYVPDYGCTKVAS